MISKNITRSILFNLCLLIALSGYVNKSNALNNADKQFLVNFALGTIACVAGIYGIYALTRKSDTQKIKDAEDSAKYADKLVNAVATIKLGYSNPYSEPINSIIAINLNTLLNGDIDNYTKSLQASILKLTNNLKELSTCTKAENSYLVNKLIKDVDLLKNKLDFINQFILNNKEYIKTVVSLDKAMKDIQKLDIYIKCLDEHFKLDELPSELFPKAFDFVDEEFLDRFFWNSLRSHMAVLYPNEIFALNSSINTQCDKLMKLGIKDDEFNNKISINKHRLNALSYFVKQHSKYFKIRILLAELNRKYRTELEFLANKEHKKIKDQVLIVHSNLNYPFKEYFDNVTNDVSSIKNLSLTNFEYPKLLVTCEELNRNLEIIRTLIIHEHHKELKQSKEEEARLRAKREEDARKEREVKAKEAEAKARQQEAAAKEREALAKQQQVDIALLDAQAKQREARVKEQELKLKREELKLKEEELKLKVTSELNKQNQNMLRPPAENPYQNANIQPCAPGGVNTNDNNLNYNLN